MCLLVVHSSTLAHYYMLIMRDHNTAVSYYIVCTCHLQDADVFVVSVRNDYLLHCYDLSSGSAIEVAIDCHIPHTNYCMSLAWAEMIRSP